jgi:hypothetical protein
VSSALDKRLASLIGARRGIALGKPGAPVPWERPSLHAAGPAGPLPEVTGAKGSGVQISPARRASPRAEGE